jgi:hypothetical protein
MRTRMITRLSEQMSPMQVSVGKPSFSLCRTTIFRTENIRHVIGSQHMALFAYIYRCPLVYQLILHYQSISCYVAPARLYGNYD